MRNLSLKRVESARNFPARVATFLDREGIEPGDRVELMLPNSPVFALAY
jgi:acyl-CoA synthetase (AMP-forming)/AMP-acid ligase II